MEDVCYLDQSEKKKKKKGNLYRASFKSTDCTVSELWCGFVQLWYVAIRYFSQPECIEVGESG